MGRMGGAHALERLIASIGRARRVTVLTGAGVSAASGVPTFRGANGLWKHFRVEDLATPDAFARSPEVVWEWYAWRRERIAACQPNRAHEVLAAWTGRMPGCQLITQNVDDLHVRAGAQRLIRLHGSLWELACWRGCGAEPGRWRDERVPLPQPLPPCVHCSGPARPAVVWFGEPLDAADLQSASDATHCDVFLTVGTSAVVYPAAGLTHLARRRGALVAEINVEATPATPLVDLSIQAPAEEALDRIERGL